MTTRLPLIRSLLIAGLATVLFQIGLHLLFDLNIARLLRDLYIGLENPYGKGPWILCDVFLPAAIAGTIFGLIAKPLPQKQVWLASSVLGFVIAALIILYPQIVSFDLWWLPHGSWKLARLVLFMGLFASLGCRLALEAGQRSRNGSRESATK